MLYLVQPRSLKILYKTSMAEIHFKVFGHSVVHPHHSIQYHGGADANPGDNGYKAGKHCWWITTPWNGTTHSPSKGNLMSPVHLPACFRVVGENQQPEKTHTNMGRTFGTWAWDRPLDTVVIRHQYYLLHLANICVHFELVGKSTSTNTFLRSLAIQVQLGTKKLFCFTNSRMLCLGHYRGLVIVSLANRYCA